jgi:hypothetical protein
MLFDSSPSLSPFFPLLLYCYKKVATGDENLGNIGMQEDEKERNQHTKVASRLLLHLEDHQGSDVSQHLLSLKTCTLAPRSKTVNIFHVSLHAIK